jgi:outer membrane protein assembly factor BamB
MFGLDDKKNSFDDNESLESNSTRQEGRTFGRHEVLLCATHGKIYAIHKKDGARCWRQDFPTGALGGIVSLFVTDNDTVIVGGNGKTASLDLFTGVTTWVNKMKVMKAKG